MFEALLICFREGLESFLLVAIIALTLKKANVEWLMSAVKSGVGLAVTGSVVIGIILAKIGQLSPFWEGWLAIIAAIAVIWCITHMMRGGHGIGKEISTKLESAVARGPMRAWLLVFSLTIFMVAREGIEAATMLASFSSMREAWDMAIGGAIGLLLATYLCWLWLRYGRRVELQLYFKITAWMMGVFTLQLLILGFHEFTEANSLPLLDNARWHLATESIAEGWIGQLISFSLIMIPLLWLLLGQLAKRGVAGIRPNP